MGTSVSPCRAAPDAVGEEAPQEAAEELPDAHRGSRSAGPGTTVFFRLNIPMQQGGGQV